MITRISVKRLIAAILAMFFLALCFTNEAAAAEKYTTNSTKLKANTNEKLAPGTYYLKIERPNDNENFSRLMQISWKQGVYNCIQKYLTGKNL